MTFSEEYICKMYTNLLKISAVAFITDNKNKKFRSFKSKEIFMKKAEYI